MNLTSLLRSASGLARVSLPWFLALALAVGSWALGRRWTRAHRPAPRYALDSRAPAPAVEAARALELAASRGDLAAVRRLLAGGAGIERASMSGTPLSRALRGGYQQVAQLLVVRGADPNLAVAAELGAAERNAEHHGSLDYDAYLPVLKALVRHGADVNAQDEEGGTPLMAAARHGRPAAVRLLLAAGARVSARVHEGKTASALALESQRWVDDQEEAEATEPGSPREPRPNYRAAARILRGAGAAR